MKRLEVTRVLAAGGLLLVLGALRMPGSSAAEGRWPVSPPAGASRCQRILSDAAAEGKHAFLLFCRQDDRATQAAEQTVDAALRTRDDEATWIKVRVTDPAEQALVARYDALRSPLPVVMALAPNGAVTGVFPLQVADKQIDRAIVTPQYADMLKGLQSQRFALVCVQPADNSSIPKGVVDFENDPHFKGRTHRTVVHADDPAEARFFEGMRVDRNITAPLVVLFAPPGAFVGTFDSKVTSDQLSKAIHDAGRCGPNCKHHHHK